MKITIAVLCLLMLSACRGMTDEEVRVARAVCRAKDGYPVVMARLDGTITEVRCL